MVTRRAIVIDGEVRNVVLGGDEGVPIPDGARVQIGDLYDGLNFSRPAPVESPAGQMARIVRERDAACAAPVEALGRQWQADQRSRELLGHAITLAQAGLPLPPVWRDADNDNMVISTLADLLAIAVAMANQTQAAYEQSWARKAALAAALTPEDVVAV